MAISSLILDLDPGPDGAALQLHLAADPRFVIGPRHGQRLAVVADTPSALDDLALWEWLQEQPGLRLLTLVRAYLDDEPVPAGVGFSAL